MSDLSSLEQARYEKREDVIRSHLYRDVPLETSNERVQETVLSQLLGFLRHVRLPFLKDDIVDMVMRSRYTQVDLDQQCLERFVLEHVSEKIAVGVDKDLERRVLMDRAGYLFRLHAGYVLD